MPKLYRVGMCLAVFALAFCLMGSGPLQAQTVTGTILGNVEDPSGAAVANAQITVSNQDTGVARTAASNSDGVYNIPSLLPGKYTVEARAAGFSPAQVKDVELSVGSDTRVDLKLQVGQVTQQVTVTEAIPTVQTTSSEVSQVVTQDLIQQIPLNARDIQQLAVVNPGVQWMKTSFGGNQLTVSGDRPSNNRYLQEGMDMTWSYKLSPISLASGIMLGTEAVKEFKVMTSNFTVEYGEQSGGVVNTLFKSGTNSLHGSAYEFYRNSAFDARNFFDQAPGETSPPPFHRNQFGASLGGPIRKDKTFFFVNYEGFRHSLSQSLLATLPDATERAKASAGIAKIFFNPANPLLPTCNGGPSGTAGLCFYYSHPVESIVENYGLVKIDHSFGSKNTLSATYNVDQSWRVTPVQTGVTADDVVNDRQTFTLQDTHIVSANVVNTARFGINRIWFNSQQDLVNPSAIDASYIITANIVPCAHLCSSPTPILASGLATPLPPIVVPNMTTIGSAIQPQYNYAPRWHGFTAGILSDDVNYLRGTHAFQFGFQGKKWQDNIENYMGNPRGAYTFANVDQFMAGGPAQSFGFFLPGKTNLGRSMRLQFISFYAQDTWKVKPNLTLTYGLRWERLSPPSETHGELVTSYNPTPQTLPANGQLVGTFYLPSNRNFAPRVGFNWDPFNKGKMSVRGGFGMFFNQVEDNAWFAGISGQYPFTTSVTLTSQTPGGAMTLPFQQSILNAAITGGLANVLVAPGGPELHPHTPTKYGYNLMIQEELPSHMSLLIGYVGSQIRHNGRGINFQEYYPTTVETPGQLPAVNGVPIPGSAVNPNCTAPGEITCLYWAGSVLSNANVVGLSNPATAPYATDCTGGVTKNCFNNNNWASLSPIVYDGNTSYNSVQVALERRMSAGLYVRFNYTLSECVTDSDDDLPASELNGGGAAWTPTYSHQANRHRCSFQGRNSANLSLNYDFPLGKNASSRLAKMVLAGWQITSLTALSSGLPFDVRDGLNMARALNSGNGNSHPDLVAGCDANSLINKNNPVNYINVSCLSAGTPGYLGNLGPLALTGPGLANTDLGLKKNIALRETRSLQLSADMFNAFNRTNFSVPSSTTAFVNNGTTTPPPNAGAGVITTTVTTSRQLQIGAKFIF
jgi:carboxypeptidase family protein